MGKVRRVKGSPYWRLDYSYDGRRIRESSKTTDKAEAERMLKVKEGQIADRRRVIIHKTTVSELLDDYVEDCRLRGKKSTDGRGKQVIIMKPYFAGMLAKNFTTAESKRFIEWRKTQIHSGTRGEMTSNATINMDLSILICAFKLGMKCTPPKVETVPYIPMLKQPLPRDVYVTIEELEIIKKFLPEWMKGVAIFAFWSGWREKTILRLKWDHVILNDKVWVDPKDTKTGQLQTCYLVNSEMKEIFQKQRQLQMRGGQNEYVFGNWDNSRNIGGSTCRLVWQKTILKAGLRHLVFHDLRRSCATYGFESGMQTEELAKITGHSPRSLDKLREYIQITGDQQRQRHEMLSEYILKQKEKFLKSQKRVINIEQWKED